MKPIIRGSQSRRNPLKSQPAVVTADLVPAPALMVRPSLNFGRVSLPKIFRFWFPAIVYSAIIYYGSSIPRLKAPVTIPYFDKIFHILEYLPFGFLTARALFLAKGGDGQFKGLVKSVILSYRNFNLLKFRPPLAGPDRPISDTTPPQAARREIVPSVARPIWLSLAYGLSDEFHQAFVPGRESGLDDALADMVGGAFGGWLFTWSQKRHVDHKTI